MTQEQSPPADAGLQPAQPRHRGSLRADVVSSYVLTGSRILAWAGVSACVYRRQGAEAFALLALLRGTITLIGYTSLGVAPAMVRMLAEAADEDSKEGATVNRGSLAAVRRDFSAPMGEQPPTVQPLILEYRAAAQNARKYTNEQRVYASGSSIAFASFFVAAVVSLLYAIFAKTLYRLPFNPEDAFFIALFFGMGMAVRLGSEPLSAVLQVRGLLSIDNSILAAAELFWFATVFLFQKSDISQAAFCWAVSAIGIAVVRAKYRNYFAPELIVSDTASSWLLMRRLLAFGSAIVIAQLADFLYAPTDYILINRLLDPVLVAAYAPAVQIDGALLLLVAGLATTLFPHAAVAHAAGDYPRLLRLYRRGTIASAGVLLIAALVTLLLAPLIFRIWLGQDLPLSRMILPLVLIHTVVGGSSAVGRSILLGMGRVRAFTISVLIAGVANVILSAMLATVGGLGLKGIVLGTIIVVVARCAIWMPWYVMKTLRPPPDAGV